MFCKAIMAMYFVESKKRSALEDKNAMRAPTLGDDGFVLMSLGNGCVGGVKP